MSTTGLEVFGKSIQTTNMWLDEIMENMGPTGNLPGMFWARCYGRREIGSRRSLPPISEPSRPCIRGTYYDQYRPSASTEKTRSLETFLSTIADELKFSRPVNTKEAVQVVCSVLAKHADDGQVAKVWQALPQEIRQVATAKLHS
ncbi:hypothetical protein Rleg5DRAFT_1340 [Rhizobium leguminosarum bv. viciae WSM1455]|nr:hypothetical protein Rleg5DRAFT_1340 [Rhizobium leguminosarum bv. viciae WSM1455]